MTAALTPADLIAIENVMSALKIGAGFDWKGALKAFESGSVEDKIIDGAIAADDLAKIVGLFVPPVAVVANDVGIAISVAQIAYSILEWFRKQPPVRTAPKSFWGRVTALF